MASVFKRPKSKYWHAGWRSANGKFRLRSTKHTERSKALLTALEWERVDKKVGRGEAVEGQLRQVINDILAKVGESTIEVHSIKKWLNEWVSDTESDKSAGTAERYRGVVDAFIEHLGDRADRPLTALSASNVQSFIAQRKKQGVSVSTRILDAKILRTALNLARRQGIITTNPAEAVALPNGKALKATTQH